jgi:hypothetical protein
MPEGLFHNDEIRIHELAIEEPKQEAEPLWFESAIELEPEDWDKFMRVRSEMRGRREVYSQLTADLKTLYPEKAEALWTIEGDWEAARTWLGANLRRPGQSATLKEIANCIMDVKRIYPGRLDEIDMDSGLWGKLIDTHEGAWAWKTSLEYIYLAKVCYPARFQTYRVKKVNVSELIKEINALGDEIASEMQSEFTVQEYVDALLHFKVVFFDRFDEIKFTEAHQEALREFLDYEKVKALASPLAELSQFAHDGAALRMISTGEIVVTEDSITVKPLEELKDEETPAQPVARNF